MKPTVFKSPRTAVIFPPAFVHEVRPSVSFKPVQTGNCFSAAWDREYPRYFAVRVFCQGGPARDPQISDVGCVVVGSRAQPLAECVLSLVVPVLLLRLFKKANCKQRIITNVNFMCEVGMKIID